MGTDPYSTSTGVARENEPVVTNKLEGIVLKANSALSLGREAASSGKDFKKQAKKNPKAFTCRCSSKSHQVRVNLLDLSPGKPKDFVIK